MNTEPSNDQLRITLQNAKFALKLGLLDQHVPSRSDQAILDTVLDCLIWGMNGTKPDQVRPHALGFNALFCAKNFSGIIDEAGSFTLLSSFDNEETKS